MLVIINIFLWFASIITVALASKIMWDYLLIYFYAHYIVNSTQAKLKETLFCSPGAWALITGATDGIGRAYAFELARLGFNIIIHGRSEEKLAKTLNEIKCDKQIIKERHLDSSSGESHWIRTLNIDLSTKVDGPTVENQVNKVLRGANLRVLVNNAGVSYDNASLFMDLDFQHDSNGYKICQKLVDVNVIGVLNFTRACLKHMPLAQTPNEANGSKTHEKLGGILINLSSFSAVGATPYITVYASCKAFVWHFGRCLAAEYQARGLIVQTVVPYLVVTKMTRLKKVTLFRPSPETYVKSALKMVGVQEITFGYLPHALVGLFFGLGNYFVPKATALMTMKVIKARIDRMNKWE